MRPMLIAAVAVGAMTLTLCAAQETASPSKQKLDELAWMSGSWVMQRDGLRVEEHWTSPRAGTMMAVGRTMRGQRTVFYEFLRIEQSPDGTITYHAAPKGRSPATPFKMVELTPDKIVFKNYEHDFPNRITYWRDGRDGMGARVEGKNGENPESFSFKRAVNP